MATAADVMDRVASVCLNDPSKGTYTYTVQLPHLKAAWEELAQILTSVGIPVVKDISGTLTYTANGASITPPSDIFIPIALYERGVGETDDDWVLMEEKFWDVKRVMSEHQTLDYWNWREQIFQVAGCSVNREVYCEYWKDITLAIATSASTITINNVINALAFRTGELLARYVGSNPERANSLAFDYSKAIDLITDIGVKNNQGQAVRRKGYRIGRR